MNIIQKQPNPSGAYPPIHPLYGVLPEGYAIIPASLDMAEFYNYNGFVTLTVENDIVTGFVPNIEAWEAWKASLQPEPEPIPTAEEDRDAMLVDLEYRMTLLELGVNE